MATVQTIYASCDREATKSITHRDDERLGAEFSRYSPVVLRKNSVCSVSHADALAYLSRDVNWKKDEKPLLNHGSYVPC